MLLQPVKRQPLDTMVAAFSLNACPAARARAFSLVELLVVIALIVMMAALAGPAVNAMKGRASSSTAVGYARDSGRMLIALFES